MARGRATTISLDEAIAILLQLLKAGSAGSYGYDLWPPVGAAAAVSGMALPPFEDQLIITDISPAFYDAAWELCRRGIVRPGVRKYGEQFVGDGYSLTAIGREALGRLDQTTILIAQPGSLARSLASYRTRFGDGFYQRSLEAIRCREAEAWLACCAMTGAAAESVLLAVAIAKTGDEDGVLKAYRQAGGRQKVLNLVVGQADAHRRNSLTLFARIISTWRDEAAHGMATPQSTANADEGLRQLLHMCQWVDREWDELTA